MSLKNLEHEMDSIEEDLSSSLIILSESLIYASYVLNEINSRNSKLPVHDLAVLSLLRKAIEKAEGVFALTDNFSYETTLILSRALFENAISLKYIFMNGDKERIERSNSYAYFACKDLLRMTENPNYKEINTDVKKIFNTADLNKKLKEELNKPELKKVQKEYNRLKNKHKREKYFPQWYTLYNKKEILTITELMKFVTSEIGDEQVKAVSAFYQLTSHEVHSINAYDILNGTVIKSSSQFNPRRESIAVLSAGFLYMVLEEIIETYIPEIMTHFHSYHQNFRDTVKADYINKFKNNSSPN